MDATLLKLARSGNSLLLCEVADRDHDLLLGTTPNKNTALHIASRHGHINFAVQITNRCPSLLLAENYRGDTALHIAARSGYFCLAGKLINCAINESLDLAEMLRKRNGELNTALHEAAWNRYGHVVKLLITADPESALIANRDGASPLYLAAEVGDLECVVRILEISRSFDSQAHGGPYNRTPLHAAVIRGHLDILKLLIEEMPALTKQADEYQNSPLHYAADIGNLEMVRMLLRSDISVAYITDADGRSAFHVAADNGHVDVIKELILLCPDSGEVVDRKGRNALHVAVQSEKLQVVRYILKSDDLKELINEPDNEGNTPLHLAIIKRHGSLLNLLLKDKRVDMRAINNNGMTALDIAESDKELTMKFRKIVICTALIQNGAPRGLRRHFQSNTAHVKHTTAPRIESYKALSKVILVVAGLIITVTFAAAFTIPGGYNNDGPNKGMAVLIRKPTFWVCMITDAIALFSSIATALLLIWAGIGDQDLLVGTIFIATRLMAIALGSLTLSFVSALWLTVSKWLCIVVLSISFVIFCLSLHYFCFQFSLLLLFSKQIFLNYPLSLLFHSKQSSVVPSLESMERRNIDQPLVKSRYSITNVSRLFMVSEPPTSRSSSS